MGSRHTALKLARGAKGLRLLDVANRLKLTEHAVGRIERLDLAVSDEQLEQFAELYEVPIEFLQGRGFQKVNGAPPRMRN